MNNDRELVRRRPLRLNAALLMLVVFVGFLVFGFSENSKGPAIPRMQADFGLDELQIGLLLSVNSLGYLIACTFTGALSARLGLRATTLLSFGSMAVSGVCMALSTGYTSLTLSYFLMYVGNGMLEIALALLSARIFVRNTGMMMNLAHFFYGLSSVVAPLLATSLMGAHMFGATLGWGGMYLVILSLSVIPMIPSAFSAFPANGDTGPQRAKYAAYLRDPSAWLVVAVLSLGVISEMAVGGWLANFLEKAYGWSEASASGMLSAFFVCFTLARLVLGPVTDKIGFIRSLILFSGFSGLCTLAAIAAGEPGAFLFALAGVGIAPVYPTVMAYLARRYAGNSDTAITFTVTLMGIANVAGNLLIGAITDGTKRLAASGGHTEAGLLRGLQAGYAFIGLCALLCAATSYLLYRYLKKRGEAI